RPRMSMGDFTETDVMLTIRPNRLVIMPSTVALIRKIGVSMLASSARSHASRSHSRKSPGGGPPALFTRMSGLGHAWSSCARTARVRDLPRPGRAAHAGRVANLLRGRLECVLGARVDREIDTLAGQRHGAALAEALAGGADDRVLALDSQIHGGVAPLEKTSR